jgi:hypothetical protein
MNWERMARSFDDRDNVFSIVLEDDVNDRGLAMTSSFSNMVIVAQTVAHLEQSGRLPPNRRESCVLRCRNTSQDCGYL